MIEKWHKRVARKVSWTDVVPDDALAIASHSMGGRDFAYSSEYAYSDRETQTISDPCFEGHWDILREQDVDWVWIESAGSLSTLLAEREGGAWTVTLTVPDRDGEPYRGHYWETFHAAFHAAVAPERTTCVAAPCLPWAGMATATLPTGGTMEMTYPQFSRVWELWRHLAPRCACEGVGLEFGEELERGDVIIESVYSALYEGLVLYVDSDGYVSSASEQHCQLLHPISEEQRAAWFDREEMVT